MINSSVDPDMPLYTAMCIMFVVIFIASLFGLRAASTKLAREKALAFVLAFGIRDLAWASLYLAAATGWIQNSPGVEMFFNQIYAGSTLLYIPIVAYGILKLQLLDIEIRLQSTITNTLLAATFVAVYYLISEVANNLISNQFGEIIGFLVCAVLTIFLAPLHRRVNRFAEKLVRTNTNGSGCSANRGLQIYSAALEEALAYGEINSGQIALLDRLKQSLQVSDEDARRTELDHQFNRAAVSS